MAFDTRQMRLRRFGTFHKPMPISEAMQPSRKALEGLPPAAWDCAITVGGDRFACVGHQKPKDEFFEPVQVVESGHFFQRAVITGLSFSDAGGHKFPGSGRLEISVWPDRLAFHLTVDANEEPFEGTIELRVGEADAKPLSRSEVLLRLTPKHTPVPTSVEAERPMRVEFDEVLGCHTLALPEEAWSNANGTYYPEEHLDRLDRWRLILRNDSAEEAIARLMFVQQNHLPITGLTPLLCDPSGTPTGIPVQISKNWHRRPDKGTLLHEGPWFHGCTLVHLPPRSRREFMYSMAYARYGGVFAASHAQLCLIGWGHNQFWNEAAIGSFGESICFEPGRVQRRCFIDDVRPLLTLSEAPGAKPYGWAENCGGGDFLMWQDEGGRYQPFCATRADYRAYGPCLTEVVYGDETAEGELAERVTVSLPRSDDYLRTYFRLRCDVKKPVRWQRLAFFQVGADFYNETPSRRLAIGNMDGVRLEWDPKHAKEQFDRRAEALSGRQPWISIHGLDSSALKPGTAAASRGLIVRQWRARLDGKLTQLPYASTWCTEWGKGDYRTVVELSPPPNLTELQPGDFVEAELELVIFPAKASAYYGPDVSFRAALKKNSDSWQLVCSEAAANALRVEPIRGALAKSYPVELVVDGEQAAEFKVAGGMGYVPISFTGLAHSRGYAVWLDDQRVDQSVHGNDFWQTDYEPASRRWRITYNLCLNTDGGSSKRVRFGFEQSQ
jgi:hypothetical protein